MKYKLIIFDLDGTILDTLKDLYISVNHALANAGLSKRTIEEVRNFVGNGAANLISRASDLPQDDPKFGQVLDNFNSHYKEHSSDNTAPYDGIIDVLSTLKAKGSKLAVVSNKPDYGVQILCKQNFDGLLDYAVGERTGIAKKPDPASVYEVINKFKSDKSETVYIGDSEVDIKTAINAGVDCISVTWGFKDKEFLIENNAKIVADTPGELLKILLN